MCNAGLQCVKKEEGEGGREMDSDLRFRMV